MAGVEFSIDHAPLLRLISGVGFQQFSRRNTDILYHNYASLLEEWDTRSRKLFALSYFNFFRRVAEQLERNGKETKLYWRECLLFFYPLDLFFCTSGSSVGWNNYETWNLSSSVVGNYKIALFNYVVFYRRAFLTFVTSAKWKETQLFIISIIILTASKVYLEAIHF